MQMMSFRLQSNYSSTVTLHGGPVVLRSIRATPCCALFCCVCVLQELDIIYKIPHCVPISAHHEWNFDDLLEKMWQYLCLVRL